MSPRALTTLLSASVLAFGTPLWAQEAKTNSEGQRPNPSGGSQGSAVARPSGSEGGSSSGAGSSSSAGSSGSRPAGDPFVRGPGNTDSAPARPERRAVPRSNADQDRGTGANARPSTSRNSDDQRRVSPGSGSSAVAGDASSERRRAVPTYARPRDGRPAVGTAVERRGRPPVIGGSGNSSYYYYDPYFRYSNYYNRYPYGYYYAGYGLGLGYFYDPGMWGYYSPYGYGGDPYYYGGGYSRERAPGLGGLRLKVKPEQGQVYVDGYYVGEVDSFDGVFQKLQIEAGAHRVEIRADGYETVQFEVMVTPGETVTYKGDMKRIQ